LFLITPLVSCVVFCWIYIVYAQIRKKWCRISLK
jgi:hypothetical protein